MAMRSTSWPVESVDHLCRRRAEGASGGIIAVELGKTRCAVLGKLHRMKLRFERLTQVVPYHRPKAAKIQPAQVKPRASRKAVRKPVKPAAPPALPPPVLVKPKPRKPSVGVRLVKAMEHHCRAVLPHRGTDGLAMFCGEPKIWRSSFCAKHHKIFWQEPQERKSNDTRRAYR